jgi:hypothetical protein
MTETCAMKYIFFLLVTFSFQFVLGVQTFSGYMTKKDKDFYFTPKNSEFYYKIAAQNPDVQDSLDRLSNGDFIAGNGTLDTANKKLSIKSIDYVGLRKLLGPWIGTEGTLLFKDFSTMRFTPRFFDINLDSRLTNYQKEFRYSLTPSDGNEWGLFLSDDKSTTFATVEFTKNKVIIKIFESESGKIVRTLKLERP